MTATPPDPFATQNNSTADPDVTAPVDEQTLRLREENRALRELLAAQVQASQPQPQPGCLRRIGWALISAPGAALVGWRALLGREDAAPMTSRRVGSATLTVLYTLAIYGALVLLVVSWNAPNNGIAGPTSASPVRVPLAPLPALPAEESPSDWETTQSTPPVPASPPEEAQQSTPQPTSTPDSQPADKPNASEPAPSSAAPTPTHANDAAPAAPRSTLRITEIPAEDPMAWVDSLKDELARCAELSFFERPDCAWAARKQYCEPNHGWGVVKECPTRP